MNEKPNCTRYDGRKRKKWIILNKSDERVHDFSHWNWRKYITYSVIQSISLSFKCNNPFFERQGQYFQNVWPDNYLLILGLMLDFVNLYLWCQIRGVIDKFVSFFHRIIIYGWIYIIFCHYQQQSVINRKKTFNFKVRQTCDVNMTLMTSYVGDVVVKTLEDRCGWCTLSDCKCYSTSAIIVKFSGIICT